MRILLTLSLVAMLASSASAQGAFVLRSGEKGLETFLADDPLTEAEVRFMDELELRLGKRTQSSAIRVPYGARDLMPGDGRMPHQGRDVHQRENRRAWGTPSAEGVAARFRGLEVRRLRFQSAHEAQLFALYAPKTIGSPTLVEARGRQVVIARGERVADPAELAKIRSAAWSVLPHAPGAPSVAGVTLSRSTWAIETRIPNEGLDSFVAGAIKEAADLPPGPNRVVTSTQATESWKGHSHSVETRARGSSLWVSGGHEGILRSPPIRSLAETLRRGSEALETPAEGAQQGQEAQASSPEKATKERSRGIADVLKGTHR